MYFDDNRDGDPNHATIITKIVKNKGTNNMIYYSAHTEPRKDKPLSYYFGQENEKNAQAIIVRMKEDVTL